MSDSATSPTAEHVAVGEGFTRTASVYDEVLRHNADGARRLVAAIPDGDHRRVLDVGCGTGFAALEMAARFGTREVVGVDPAEGMLRVFREKVAGREDLRVDLVAADVMNLPVPDGSVDAVISAMAFHWFPDKPGALREMARRLRPGGVLAVLASGSGTDAEFASVLRGIDPPVPAAWVEVFDRIHRDVPWMMDHLEHAGLEIVDVWIESRHRRTPAEDYLARIQAVASHLSEGMPEDEALAHGARVADAVVAASGPRGFEYTFNKLFAIARRPEG
jgi:ubiquinone/menaquinone biosynthesis C-methylase UbiE